MSNLLSEVEAFMAAHGLSDCTFGRLALNDPHFVRQLRNGRDCRVSTEARVRRFMLTYRPGSSAEAA